MAIIRLNPWYRPFLRPALWDEDQGFPELTMTEGLNVYEEDGKVFVQASVPGIPAEEVEVTYEDGVLTVSGSDEEKEVEKKKNRIVHKMEKISSFRYTTVLPRPVEEKTIEAKVENGVVTISAAIAEAAKPKKIAVKTVTKK